jgi:hypothetical protein
MKKFLSGIFAATLMSTMVVAAQGDKPQQPAPGGAAQSSASKTVTVAGCIQNAPAAPAGGGAAAAGGGAAASSAKFVLSMKPSTGAAGAPAGGAVGTGGSGGTRYQLDGDDKTISPHVNHQVEITGTLQGPSAAAGSATASPTLKVESVKMISAMCS